MNKTEKMEEFRSKLDKGFKLTLERLLDFKRYKKTPLIVCENDKILEIYPNEFENKIMELRKDKLYEKEENVQMVNEPFEKIKRDKE